MAAALIVRYCTVLLFAMGVVTVMELKVHVCLYMLQNFGLWHWHIIVPGLPSVHIFTNSP